MYRINDKASAIKEVQKYLSYLNTSENGIIANGIYDEKTVKSVKSFQSAMGISESGKVDFETFVALYSEYVKESAKNQNSTIKFPLNEGDYSIDLLSISSMMKRLLSYYRINLSLRPSGYFSEELKAGVLALKKVYKLENSSKICNIFYGRMIKDLESIQRNP